MFNKKLKKELKETKLYVQGLEHLCRMRLQRIQKQQEQLQELADLIVKVRNLAGITGTLSESTKALDAKARKLDETVARIYEITEGKF